VTEFIGAEQVIAGFGARPPPRHASHPTIGRREIQRSTVRIPALLLAAARIAARASPVFLDPTAVAGCTSVSACAERPRGAARSRRDGRDGAPESSPRSTAGHRERRRIGWGPESATADIVELARRLEDVGVADSGPQPIRVLRCRRSTAATIRRASRPSRRDRAATRRGATPDHGSAPSNRS